MIQRTAKSQNGISWSRQRLFGETPLAGTAPVPDLSSIEPDSLPYADARAAAFGRLTPSLALALPESSRNSRKIKAALQQAGCYQPYAYQSLAAARYVGMMLSIMIGGALLVVVAKRWETTCLVGLVAGMIASWWLPVAMLRKRAARRAAEIAGGLPDLIDLLSMCESQKLALPAALEFVGGELSASYPALAEEIAIVGRQAKLGSFERALDNFGQRVGVPEVQTFASFVAQTERLGTSVAAALNEYSDRMRERLAQGANQASFRLFFPALLCLVTAAFLILAGPAIVEFSQPSNGTGRRIGERNVSSQSRSAFPELNGR